MLSGVVTLWEPRAPSCQEGYGRLVTAREAEAFIHHLLLMSAGLALEE